MNHSKSKKKFDAVLMMRKIRDEFSQKYLKNPDAENADLARIREKYGIRSKEKI